MKDKDRLMNYWLSQQAELVALAPKRPFIYAMRPKINVKLVAKEDSSPRKCFKDQ